MTILLLGAPGSGKGTQGSLISSRLGGIPVISTGDMLRAAIKEGSEAGLKAKSYMDAGGLVPDEVVIDVVRQRLKQPDCQKGYILDGFPRTIPQAQALEDAGLTPGIALSIDVEDAVIEKRMTGRRVCSDCGDTYHIDSKKPAKEGACDKCSAKLMQRKDDAPETVLARLKTYHEQTEPLLDFYGKLGCLRRAEGHEELEVTTERVRKALGL